MPSAGAEAEAGHAAVDREGDAGRRSGRPSSEVEDHGGHLSGCHEAARWLACFAGQHAPGETCPAQPDPDDLAQIWAGRARMAAARRDADLPLDTIDLEALRRTAR